MKYAHISGQTVALNARLIATVGHSYYEDVHLMSVRHAPYVSPPPVSQSVMSSAQCSVWHQMQTSQSVPYEGCLTSVCRHGIGGKQISELHILANRSMPVYGHKWTDKSRDLHMGMMVQRLRDKELFMGLICSPLPAMLRTSQVILMN